MRRYSFWVALGLGAILSLPVVTLAKPPSGGRPSGQHYSGGNRGGYYGGGNYNHGGNYYHNGGYNHRGYNYGIGVSLFGVPFYGYGGSPYYGRSSYYYGPSVIETPDVVVEEPADSVDPNAAGLEVLVPANAELWFDDYKSTQTGSVRHFDSPPLTPGKTYTYDIRARWMDENGKAIDRTRQVKVQAGSRIGVDMNKP